MAIIAELSTFPIGEGTSLSRYVKAAVRELESCNVRVTRGAMGTVIEADDLDILMAAVKRAHEAVVKAGAKRVYTTLKIDDRRDVERTADDKLASLE